MKQIVLYLCCVFLLQGCAWQARLLANRYKGKVSVVGKEVGAIHKFTPSSRIAIASTRYGGGSGGGRSPNYVGSYDLGSLVIDLVGAAISPLLTAKPPITLRVGADSTSLDWDQYKILQDSVLPAIDHELARQSPGTFTYVSQSELKLNQETSDQAYYARLIKDNQLDGVLVLNHFGHLGSSLIYIIENISLYNQDQKYLATVRIFIDGGMDHGPQPYSPWVEDNDEDSDTLAKDTRVKTTWDYPAYYRVFAKKIAGYFVKYVKEGPYELKGNGILPLDERPPLIPAK